MNEREREEGEGEGEGKGEGGYLPVLQSQSPAVIVYVPATAHVARKPLNFLSVAEQ